MARTGRPRSFDRDLAVKTAMHLFWEYGFEGVSLEQLRRTMGGISSASFYAAFGSKEALYRETLNLYVRTDGKVVASLLDADLSPRDKIELTLRRAAVMQTSATHPTGCMVALSAMVTSASGAEVRALTTAVRATNRAAFLVCVQAGVDTGTLRPTTNIAGLATLYDALLVGFAMQARDGVAADALDAAVTQALLAWDANRSD